MTIMKYMVLIIALMWATVGVAHDEQYYSVHPNDLQKAIEACAQHKSKGMSCERLKNMASRVNESAYQLRANPQEYGKIILDLQEKVAKQEAALSGAHNQHEGRASLDENKQRLQERLAIVKWLESPAG